MNSFSHYLKKVGEVGEVRQSFGQVAYASGLPGARLGEMVLFETGQKGKILSLEEDFLKLLVFDPEPVAVGARVARTGQGLKVPVGKELLGRVVDSFCQPLYTTGKYRPPGDFYEVDADPWGIEGRVRVSKSLETGVAVVDLLIPLGKGQRELVIGDRKVGKTAFILQTILHQSPKGTVCIYAGIAKRASEIKRIEEFFKKRGVMEKIVIITSGPQESAGIVYLTPYTAMAVAEYFRDNGDDVLVVLDDLSYHARFYREIALAARFFPGRDSYPVDIFYTHGKLLERAGNFKTPKGEASITALAVAETNQRDLSGYIQTNIMSMTDGHIFFDADLYGQGRRPAINPFLSVTRVGRQAQTPLFREAGRELLSFLTTYEKMRSFIHFGAEVTDQVKQILAKGELITHFFDQRENQIIDSSVQIFVLGILWVDFLAKGEKEKTKEEVNNLISLLEKDQKLRKKVAVLVKEANSFAELLSLISAKGIKMLQGSGKQLK
ncbi:F0F1 ATP synthase subunit alpha [Candidatus Shapirobacteria bacterium]|nr:F0F1 ATP synthase subunit alpha [Candidatus Shapirobacteria bacterium]